MNRLSTGFAKHEGLPAKHLPSEGEKAMQINDADVAELVDARDLKSRGPPENAALSCKIVARTPAATPCAPPDLQNIRRSVRRSRREILGAGRKRNSAEWLAERVLA